VHETQGDASISDVRIVAQDDRPQHGCAPGVAQNVATSCQLPIRELVLWNNL
jgi:hypothetical protein